MGNARTISSAAGPAAPPSARCPMVTPGDPRGAGRGSGGWEEEGVPSSVPESGARPTQGSPTRSRRMEPDQPVLSFPWLG